VTDNTPEYNQVWMGTLTTADNAGHWPIIGTVSTLSTGTFPPKTTIGDYTKDADDFISTWIISDLSGGMNIEDMNEGSDTARAWTIFADTRKPGKIALNPLVERYTWSGASGTSYPLGVVNDTFYAVIGSEICAWSEANEDFGTTYTEEAITLTPTGKPVAFVGRIFVPCGTAGYFYVTESGTGNPTVTDVTTGILTYPAAYDPDVPDVNPPKPAAFWVFDQKLWALTTGGALAWSFTGDDDDWTWPYNEAEGWYPRIESGSTPQRIIGFYNPNGDPTLFIITDRGAYRFEWGALKIVDTPVQFPPHPDFGGAVCVWRAGEDLHIAGGLDTVRYTSANVVVPLSGLARDDGVPQELRGKVYDLEPETSEMYALLGPTTGGGSSSVEYVSQFLSDGTGNDNASSPKQIALDDSGDIYIADYDNDRLKRHSSAGTFEAEVVTSLNEIIGIAVETGATPNVYVSFKNGTGDYRVRKYNSAGTVQWTSAAVTQRLTHLATDGTHVYAVLSDLSDVTHSIKKYACSDGSLTATLGSRGSGDGEFSLPYGIAYSSITGNLYVSEQGGNDRVQEITTAGVFVRKWGSNGTGDGQFTTATGVAVNPSNGNVYVADSGRDDIQEFTQTGGFVRAIGTAGTGNGQFTAVDGIAVNSSADLWAADTQSSSACRIQKFSVVMDSGSILNTNAWLAAWTGIGWYGKWKSALTGVIPTWAIVTATSLAYRLWWGASDGYLYTTKLKRFFHNPRQALIAGDDEFEEEGEIITPRFDAAMLGNWKLASHMVVFMENATSTETITIEYRTDADSGWTLLGEVDSTDKTYLPFAVDATTEFSAGVAFNWIQFRIKLFRGDDATQTPIIKSLVFCYVPIPQNARAFQFTVAFPSDEYLGRDGNEIREDLFNLVTSRQMLRLKPWPNENDQEFRGYLTATNGDDAPEALVRGSRAVNFIEIRDADYD
jgi:hypothetical protein